MQFAHTQKMNKYLLFKHDYTNFLIIFLALEKTNNFLMSGCSITTMSAQVLASIVLRKYQCKLLLNNYTLSLAKENRLNQNIEKYILTPIKLKK
jgi:hypothetical protein